MSHPEDASDSSPALDTDPALALAAMRRWNATAQRYPLDRSPAELIAAQAARAPEAPALVCGDERLSYGELDQRANRLAHRLQALGVGPDVPVAVCVQRSFAFVIGVLAALRAGGCYVPLDPNYPAERLRFMLHDTAAPVLLTEQALAGQLAGSRQIICLDSDPLPEASSAPPVSRAQPDNLAYIIYTSGSTGQPKGVQISQAGLLNLISWHQQRYQITPDDRATLLAGLGFDASVWELWPYLSAGACLYLVDEQTRLDPARLLSWLQAHAITRVFLPTPLAETLLGMAWPEHAALRTLLTGGDQLHQFPDPRLRFELVNHYGPTEASVVATAAALQPAPASAALPSIGRPIANTQVYLLSEQLEPVPAGAVGELYIGGAGLARGYWQRPALTAERFIPDRFSDQPGARLYQTGDLARFLPDGQIEFVGRADQQVKLRGFRVELGEIEAVLQRHPAIREAAVLLRDRQLVAYIVGKESGTKHQEPSTDPHASGSQFAQGAPVLGSSTELRDFLKTQLPEYMLPTVFVLLDALPLTPNGKIDRRALPTPEQSRTLPAQPFVAPRDALEEVLSQFWSEVLAVARVGVEENFFALGGHSLLATQIASRVQQVLRVELPVQELFAAPTVAGLAEAVRAHEPTPGHVDKVAQLLQRVKRMSTTDLKQALAQKRTP